jgi:hypothetical protein
MEELLWLIPAEAAYLARIPRPLSVRGFPPETDIYAYVCNDLKFGWKFIQSFLELDRPLPAQVYECQLVRPHCYLRYRNADREARSAIEPERAANWQQCLLLRCKLFRAEYDYGAIATRPGLLEDTIRVYETLFWNVRDRGRIYVTSLVYPDTRLVDFVAGYPLKEDPRQLISGVRAELARLHPKLAQGSHIRDEGNQMDDSQYGL